VTVLSRDCFSISVGIHWYHEAAVCGSHYLVSLQMSKVPEHVSSLSTA
jgi:hypothetical protein